MNRISFLAVGIGLIVVGCNSGPRDATNDPEVKAMMKGVSEQGVMPDAQQGAQSAPAGTSAGSSPIPQAAPGGP